MWNGSFSGKAHTVRINYIVVSTTIHKMEGYHGAESYIKN